MEIGWLCYKCSSVSAWLCKVPGDSHEWDDMWEVAESLVWCNRGCAWCSHVADADADAASSDRRADVLVGERHKPGSSTETAARDSGGRDDLRISKRQGVEEELSLIHI